MSVCPCHKRVTYQKLKHLLVTSQQGLSLTTFENLRLSCPEKDLKNNKPLF